MIKQIWLFPNALEFAERSLRSDLPLMTAIQTWKLLLPPVPRQSEKSDRSDLPQNMAQVQDLTVE
jgi:hypothetical protein